MKARTASFQLFKASFLFFFLLSIVLSLTLSLFSLFSLFPLLCLGVRWSQHGNRPPHLCPWYGFCLSFSRLFFFYPLNIVRVHLAGSWSASWWMPGVVPWEAVATTACASSFLPGSARRPRESPAAWLKGTSWPTPHPWWRERGWSAGWWRSDQLELSSSGMTLGTFFLLCWRVAVFSREGDKSKRMFSIM